MGNYWHRVTQQRLSRRRALTGALSATAAGAFLIACGGDGTGVPPPRSGDGPGPQDISGLLYVRDDESPLARLGGIYNGSHPNVLTTYDPMRPGAHTRIARRGYSQLFRLSDGMLQLPDGRIEGDLAETWEMAPDNLTLTVHLYPKAGFAPLAPVNGRPVHADDVLFTWERLREMGNLRGELANQVNPAAPITSIEAVDDNTVVIKLARPDVTIYSLLGTSVLGGMYILPREAASPSGVDIPRQAIGTGPYYLVEGSEAGYRWLKNPHFKRPSLLSNEPFIDEISEPVITEASIGSTRFRSGALLEYPLPPQEVLAAKDENPDLLMLATQPLISERLYFGSHPDSPFRDERLRIALMKSIDRDAFIAATSNVADFERVGLPVKTYWEGALSCTTYAGWYLDPRNEDSFPDTAANYQYDPREARRLIMAAGYDPPVAFDNTYGAPSPTSFPAPFFSRADVFLEMIEASDIWRQNRVPVDYRTHWSTEKFRFSRGNFVGASWAPDTASQEATHAMFSLYNSQGGLYMGGDAVLDELTARARMEFDVELRKALVHEAQRYNSGRMFNEKIGAAGSFALIWPALRNVNVFQGGTNWLDIATPSGLKAWIDPDKPPFG